MLQCTSCRATLRSGVRFCTQCGAPYSAPPSAPPPSASAPPRDELLFSPPVSAHAVRDASSAPTGAPVVAAPNSAELSTIVMDAPAPAELPASQEEARPLEAPRERDSVSDAHGAPLTDAPRRTRSRVARPPAERSTAATWAFVTGLAPFVVSVTGNLVGADVGGSLGAGTGSLASALVVFTVVFVLNAALLTVCGIMGGRGIRETANGYTKGRGLAIAGITLGGVNLVLWVAGIVVSVVVRASFIATAP